MEEYRNKAINLLANIPRLGGGHGGGLPLRSLLAAVFGPPRGGATGLGFARRASPWICATPLANRGNHGNRTLANSANTLPLGVGPKAHGPPLLGGEIHSREARGVNIYLGVPWYPPRWPPYRGSRRNLPRKLGEYYFPES